MYSRHLYLFSLFYKMCLFSRTYHYGMMIISSPKTQNGQNFVTKGKELWKIK